MRIGLLCLLLLCLATGGCATSSGRCQGSFEPINPLQSKTRSKVASPSADSSR
jgi:hypothetical protein